MSATGQGLDPLLAALDPDRERATVLLAQQRRRLVKYFEWRGCWEPQRLADETIARVVRRLAEGEALGPSDVRATFHAVAQNLGREETSPGTEISEDLDATQTFVGSTESGELSRERLREIVQLSLADLPPASRALLLDYYRDVGEIRGQRRRELGERLGVSREALRLRAFRLRERLEAAAGRRLAASPAEAEELQGGGQ